MIAVVGIGTGVGKTVAASILVEAVKGEYWKPIQCGNLDRSDTQAVKKFVTDKKACIHPEAYRLKTPLSPHQAAFLENMEIKKEQIILPKTQRSLIIEGVGGLLVPINHDTLFIDLLVAWQLPCLLISRHYLGSINHTLLSIEALRSRKIEIRGIIFNGHYNAHTEQTILSFDKKIPILGRLEAEAVIDPQTIQNYASLWHNPLKKIFP